jgi:hypothetical protein
MASPRELALSARLYVRSAARVAARRRRLGSEERLVFVVGSPRSGTTFTGSALGSLPGFVDLDEVQPWKAAIPALVDLPETQVAARARSILERVRLLGLRAYPQAIAVHVIRDGRDVVTSLLERGWLNAERVGADDAGHRFGAHGRFWVEPGREEEFLRVSDATRCAWAWRRYVTAARAMPERTIEVRYEDLVADPERVALPLAERLEVSHASVTEVLAHAHDRSAGRWRRDLTAEQVTDVEREAGRLLAELGYVSS